MVLKLQATLLFLILLYGAPGFGQLVHLNDEPNLGSPGGNSMPKEWFKFLGKCLALPEIPSDVRSELIAEALTIAGPQAAHHFESPLASPLSSNPSHPSLRIINPAFPGSSEDTGLAEASQQQLNALSLRLRRIESMLAEERQNPTFQLPTYQKHQDALTDLDSCISRLEWLINERYARSNSERFADRQASDLPDQNPNSEPQPLLPIYKQ